MPEETIPSPYVGLRPFREEDAPFFFGRERETRVIASNLLQERLTILYGPSGAGKSSVLQAGIVPRLKSMSSTSVVYFRNWQSKFFVDELKASCTAAMGLAGSDQFKHQSFEDLVNLSPFRLFLLLDQFEEYLLYHPDIEDDDEAEENGKAGFDAILARLMNRQGGATNILIGLREDALSKLDQRLSIRIPDLLSNTLQVERLDVPAATRAIRNPLEVFNQSAWANGSKFEIEEKLVAAILEQVRSGRTRASEGTGIGSAQTDRTLDQVETAYLELVLSELWRAEWRAQSSILRYATLTEMGGASQIVRNHVNSVMEKLDSDDQRSIAARMFLHLVTPSRTKIAQRPEDLVTYAEASEQEVKTVLNILTDRMETRILRRLSNPEQYEIFHDVLAEHILEWRRRYETQKQEAAHEREREAEALRQKHELEQANALAEAQRLRAEEQTAAAARLRRAAIRLRVLAAIAVIAAACALFAYREARIKSREAQSLNQRLHDSVEQISTLNAKAGRLAEEARLAREQGDTEKAKLLSQQAAEANQQAQQGIQSAKLLSEKASSTQESLSQAEQRAASAQQERDQLKAQVASLQSQLDSANKDLETMKSQLAAKDTQLAATRSDLDSVKSQLAAVQQQLKDAQNQLKTQAAAALRANPGTPPSPSVSNSGFDPSTIDVRWNTLPKEMLRGTELENSQQDFFIMKLSITNTSQYPITLLYKNSVMKVSGAAVRIAPFMSKKDFSESNFTIPPSGGKELILLAPKAALPHIAASQFQAGQVDLTFSGPNGEFKLTSPK